MEKLGELSVGHSRCDRCGCRADVVSGSRVCVALCARCASEKRASTEAPLKGASVPLSARHKD